jgi:hypothetical protein
VTFCPRRSAATYREREPTMDTGTAAAGVAAASAALWFCCSGPSRMSKTVPKTVPKTVLFLDCGEPGPSALPQLRRCTALLRSSCVHHGARFR